MENENRAKMACGLAARLIVGGVFIYAGYLKAASPAEEFAYAIEGYKVVPPWLALWTALALPWLELYLGLMLATGLFTRFCAASLGLLLLGFEALLAQAWLRHLPVLSCGCFGTSGSNSLAGEFARNIPLLIFAVMAFRLGAGFSLDSAVDKHD
ncbi:MAG: DoxX family protein [Elusimicrobia bacterium]|nr:DoxX family protein [Elusimicrobiota bacterium]